MSVNGVQTRGRGFNLHFLELCCPAPGVDQFDHGVFKLTRNEAAVVDPQQRLLLEGCLAAWIEASPTVQGINDISVGATC